MKKLLCALALGGLISAGWLAPSFGRVRSAHSISNADVLRAHGVSQESTDLTSYAAVAWKVMPFDGSPDGKSHNFFVQTVSLLVDGGTVRYDTVSLAGAVSESYIFDGATYRHSVVGLKEPVNTVNQAGDLDSRLTLSRIQMFGLQPFLRQLADPRTKATYLGRTVTGNDKLNVQTASGSWVLFSDESGLIQKIEIGGATIVFSDYRSVNDLQLPFNERVFKDQRLFFELGFIKIDPKPTLN